MPPHCLFQRLQTRHERLSCRRETGGVRSNLPTTVHVAAAQCPMHTDNLSADFKGLASQQLNISIASDVNTPIASHPSGSREASRIAPGRSSSAAVSCQYLQRECTAFFDKHDVTCWTYSLGGATDFFKIVSSARLHACKVGIIPNAPHSQDVATPICYMSRLVRWFSVII